MTDTRTHPLTGVAEWRFSQPHIRVNSSVFLTDLKTGEESKVNISTIGRCREGLIVDIRTALKRKTTNFDKSAISGAFAWNGTLSRTHSITLEDSRCRGKGDTIFSVRNTPGANKILPIPAKKVEEFLQVCDVIVGIPSLLLSPARKPGDWWRTDPKTACEPRGNATQDIHWCGADNALLRHPALFSSITGLFRQAFWLCEAGLGPKVLADVDRDRVEKVLTAPTWREGLELAEDLRTWICVPVPAGGHRENVPFSWYPRTSKQISYWQRFIRLQRALHRHSADEVFGGDIFAGWALLNKGYQFSGASSYWGDAKQLTAAYKNMMKLGKPRELSSEAK